MAFTSSVPLSDLAATIRPAAPPQIIENAYSDDQHRRLIDVVRRHGPWKLIMAENFSEPEEVIAATSGIVPEGVTLTWDMIGLNPVFRGYLARQGTCFYPELEDCFFNSRFLELARNYSGAKYAKPEMMLFNIQGPTPIGGPPHLDGTDFRGLSMDDSPLWLLLTMAKSRLFERWRIHKTQVVAWYYQGKIGGGFNCWPDGPLGEPLQINAPTWGRAAVVENEMMFHHGQACGPVARRVPSGLDISSTFAPDPEIEDGWQIETFGKVIQKIPREEMRFLVHWDGIVYRDFDELKQAQDHSDDIDAETAVGILIRDMQQRGIKFETPSDPMNDRQFVQLLSQAYDIGVPTNVPPDALDLAA